MKILSFLIFFISISYSSDVIIEDKNHFLMSNTYYDMTGKPHIIIELSKHNYAAGNFYAIDSDGTLWWSGPVTGGGGKYRTKPGIYSIYYKKRFHMSTKYPEPSGINNMDFSMFFNGGIALHKGSVRNFSHGCIHVDKKDIPVIFKWAKTGTKVILTNQSIRQLFYEDLNKIGDINKKRY